MLHPLGKCLAEDSKSKDSKVDESKRERVSIEELLNKKFLSIDDLLDKKSKTSIRLVRQGRAKSINYSDFYDYVRSYFKYKEDVRGE